MTSGYSTYAAPALATLIAAAFTLQPAVADSEVYGFEHLGLTGPEFESAYAINGNVGPFSDSGLTAGSTKRWDELGSSSLGQAAFIFDGEELVELTGLTGSEYVGSEDGYRTTAVIAINATGTMMTGFTGRYTTDWYGGSRGNDIWSYDGVTTTLIGLVDADHTKSDAQRLPAFVEMNEAGQTLGSTVRWCPASTTEAGDSVWLFNGTGTINVGPVDAVHTVENEYVSGCLIREATAYDLNNQGHVVGSASRWLADGSDGGLSAWYYNGSNTVLIGMPGPETVTELGQQVSRPYFINDAGDIAGYTGVYDDAGASLGGRSWLLRDGAYLQAGLYDSEHTKENGRQGSGPTHLTESGLMAGTSVRYNGGQSYLGSSAWLFDGTDTVRMGLLDAVHTDKYDGEKYSQPVYLFDNGDVFGLSSRYVGNWTSRSVWYFNGTTTQQIGLFGAGYTDYDGTQINELRTFNEAAGMVAGTAETYSAGGADYGLSAWVFDGTTTTAIPAGHINVNNKRQMYATTISDGGVVGGHYLVYGDDNRQIRMEAFIYTPGDSAVTTLSELAPDAMAADGWLFLETVRNIREIPGGLEIIGLGQRQLVHNGYSSGYRLTITTARTVTIDVNPWSAANQIDPALASSIPVAVLSVDGEFDATQVDPATVRLGPLNATSTSAFVSNMGGDSAPDISFAFNSTDTGIVCDDTSVELTGETYSGEPVSGTDSIETINCESTSCHP